ncbi:hypothetical protein HPB47_002272 [Ixodes persulcatus]|uniref:Uncharacterized protein n=1 Tax=Ixodes persulcatus TaxID=34615 RepID=A0AC60PLP1_IXOPE|nr:hypothetical protein HPB47_002272 [Ixodes persulcatus]
MSTSRMVPDTQNVDGDEICVYFSPSLYRAMDDFEPQEDDVIQRPAGQPLRTPAGPVLASGRERLVCVRYCGGTREQRRFVTFPRSGTHWAQQIIQLIVHSGKSASSFTEFTERAPFMEMQEPRTTSKPRLLRSHLPIGKVPFSPRAKYVYVARYPWDCCVSCYHLVHEAPAFNFSAGTFEEFVDVFLGGQFGFGDYFDHVLSGYKHKDKPNVFFVTYEELQRNKADVVLRLAYFLGESYGRMLEENENAFKKVLEKSTVSFMKAFMKPSLEELNVAFGRSLAHFERLKEIVRIKADEDKVNILRKGLLAFDDVHSPK